MIQYKTFEVMYDLGFNHLSDCDNGYNCFNINGCIHFRFFN